MLAPPMGGWETKSIGSICCAAHLLREHGGLGQREARRFVGGLAIRIESEHGNVLLIRNTLADDEQRRGLTHGRAKGIGPTTCVRNPGGSASGVGVTSNSRGSVAAGRVKTRNRQSAATS